MEGQQRQMKEAKSFRRFRTFGVMGRDVEPFVVTKMENDIKIATKLYVVDIRDINLSYILFSVVIS